MTNQSWEREFDQWWLERFGCEYVGTFPQGDFYDFISHLLKERDEEAVRMIDDTMIREELEENDLIGEEVKIYNSALTDLKTKLGKGE